MPLVPKVTLVVIAHNIRSSHNIGSLFRTAEALGASKLYLTGFTPYPKSVHDTRLPHVATKTHKDIAKTALGAEHLLKWQQTSDITQLIKRLKRRNYKIVALEQAPNSVDLRDCALLGRVALVLGNEPSGIDAETLRLCDIAVEIPMKGDKESLNVVQAAAIAMYHFGYL
ncbi:MAG: TrmH family RNA methyltransferase [Candidatus Saccharibacteria bacterium]|nr:TrmH family RNA methyltransferase [Candidatus Saccharibacteria bacterium]